jgi:hypothetical protein
MSEGTGWIVSLFFVAGLIAGIVAGALGYLAGFGFSMPAMVGVAAAAAYPCALIVQQTEGGKRGFFMTVSAILAGSIVLLIVYGHVVPALIGVVVASLWPAVFFFKTWNAKDDLDRVSAAFMRHLDEENRSGRDS